jgi:hypothetical protein
MPSIGYERSAHLQYRHLSDTSSKSGRRRPRGRSESRSKGVPTVEPTLRSKTAPRSLEVIPWPRSIECVGHLLRLSKPGDFSCEQNEVARGQSRYHRSVGSCWSRTDPKQTAKRLNLSHGKGIKCARCDAINSPFDESAANWSDNRQATTRFRGREFAVGAWPAAERAHRRAPSKRKSQFRPRPRLRIAELAPDRLERDLASDLRRGMDACYRRFAEPP